MNKREKWTDEEVSLLKEKYNTSTAEELKAMFPNRGMEAIRKKARKIGMYVPKEISFINRSVSRIGDKCPNWKGGKKKTDKGYVMVLRKGHHRADRNGYVMEHILVWEDATGQELPNGFCIHHINGDKEDNRIENLCMMLHSAHTIMHHSGTKRSEETKQKISAKAKERFSDKRNHPFYKEIDMESAKKMRESGMKVEDICKVLGIHKTTYYHKLEDLNAK